MSSNINEWSLSRNPKSQPHSSLLLFQPEPPLLAASSAGASASLIRAGPWPAAALWPSRSGLMRARLGARRRLPLCRSGRTDGRHAGAPVALCVAWATGPGRVLPAAAHRAVGAGGSSRVPRAATGLPSTHRKGAGQAALGHRRPRAAGAGPAGRRLMRHVRARALRGGRRVPGVASSWHARARCLAASRDLMCHLESLAAMTLCGPSRWCAVRASRATCRRGAPLGASFGDHARWIKIPRAAPSISGKRQLSH